MISSGTPQPVSMKISGHKPASMFRRHDIGSEADLRAALESVEQFHEVAKQKAVTIEASR